MGSNIEIEKIYTSVTAGCSYPEWNRKNKELLEEIEELEEYSYDEFFDEVLSNNIASNMYDAGDGNFINGDKIRNRKTNWLAGELDFEPKDNGTYLIKINGVDMGYTDAATYQKYNDYMDGVSSGVVDKVADTNENIDTSKVEDTSTGVGEGSSSTGEKWKTYYGISDDYNVKHYDNGLISIVKDGVEIKLGGYVTTSFVDGLETRQYYDKDKDKCFTIVLNGETVVDVIPSTDIRVYDNCYDSTRNLYYVSTNNAQEGYNVKYFENGHILITQSDMELELNGEYDVLSTEGGLETRYYKDLGVTVVLNGKAIVGIDNPILSKTSGEGGVTTYEYKDGTILEVYIDKYSKTITPDGEVIMKDPEGNVFDSSTSEKADVDEKIYNLDTTKTSSVFDGTSYVAEELSSKYAMSNNPEMGFELVVGQETYEMSLEDKAIVAAVIYAEAGEGSPDDALGVATAMANRVETHGNGWQDGLVGVATFQNSKGERAFSGAYDYNTKRKSFEEAFKSGNLTPDMQICWDALEDVCNGVRNHEYVNFRGRNTSYSTNQFVSHGNRYG